jgi:DNA-directed RNA polymerase subunit RPC12/RpoP
MDTIIKCEFCNKEFATIYNLKYHQKNTKSCLKLQNQNNASYKCDKCNKQFASDKYLKQHLSHCKVIKDKNEIINLRTELNELKIKYQLKEQEFKK